MTEHAARRRGTLSAEFLGEGERVVLVHGFTQTGRSWRRVARALKDRYEVITVDLPGHGESGETAVLDLNHAGELLAGTAGRATYVGYSLGGRVCLTLALNEPALVDRLVLIGASPGISDPISREERRRADDAMAQRLNPVGADGGEAIGIDAFLEEWIAGPLFSRLRPEQADLDARRTNRPSGLAATLRRLGSGTQDPSHQRLRELAMPVLLLSGEHDEKFTEIAHEMRRLIGENAHAQVVPRSGHAVPFEQPEWFVTVLDAWLEETRRRR